jgi:hypothetical protein
MTRAAGLSIPELRRWGLVYAGLAAALFVALAIWPVHASDRVQQAQLARRLSSVSIAMDVVHDLESGRIWIWDLPVSMGGAPTDAERAGRAAYQEMLRRVERGEVERPARYVLGFGSTAAPYMPWSDVPLWYSNSVTARFIEYDEDAWRSHHETPAVPEPAPGLAASGPRAFKATFAYFVGPDEIAALDRIGVGGVERVGVIAGVGYHLGLLANLLLAIAALFASGWCFLRMFLLRTHAGPHGACLRCGYPITTAGQERCSECGGALPIAAA